MDFEEVKKLNLPMNKYVIYGGSSLSVRGIRESDDIDVLITEELWDELSKKHEVEGSFINIGNVELCKEYYPFIKDPDKFILDSEIINDLPFTKLKYELEYKKLTGRDKDKKDVELIKNYLNL